MKQQAVMIELREDCIFSARAATEGAHGSLDRIPGSALLGAAASALYAGLDGRDAYLAFHSGKLRFGDALPLRGNSLGWPMPYCWYQAKTNEPAIDQRLIADKVFNFLRLDKLDGDRQPKQMRGGYVHADGFISKPAHSLRLKTAIDPDTGRAKESQLFGYDALHRGQRFVAFIEADDDVAPELFDKAVNALCGETLLGRSRSAEYGRCRVEKFDDLAPPSAGALEEERLVLWLLSDLALADDAGQPIATPDAAALGLPEAEIDWGKTFIRSRRYSPWNAARMGPDRERMVITAGSVISLKLATPLNEAQLDHLQQGVGLYREAGLGRLWINPPLLAGEQPRFDEPVEDSNKPEPMRPADPLIGWLESRDQSWKEKAEAEAKVLEKAIRDAIERARKFAGVDASLPFGPSKSQWGTVMHKAKNAAKAAGLFDALFNGDSAVIKSKGEGWDIEIPPEQSGGNWNKLAEWLKDELKADNNSDQHYIHKIRVLARRMQNDQRNRRV